MIKIMSHMYSILHDLRPVSKGIKRKKNIEGKENHKTVETSHDFSTSKPIKGISISILFNRRSIASQDDSDHSIINSGFRI